MGIGKIFLWAVFIYLVYHFVKGLIATPKSRKEQLDCTKSVKKPPGPGTGNNSPPDSNGTGEYIDYEEVK